MALWARTAGLAAILWVAGLSGAIGQLAPPPGTVAPNAPAPSASPSSGAAPGKSAPAQAVALLGLAVRSADGKALGRIVDVLVDAAGHPQAAIVDVGGFLGVGNRKVAVDWDALRFHLAGTPAAVLDLPSDQIKAAPAYDPARPVQAVGNGAAAASPPPASSPPAAAGAKATQ